MDSVCKTLFLNVFWMLRNVVRCNIYLSKLLIRIRIAYDFIIWEIITKAKLSILVQRKVFDVEGTLMV